MANRHETGRTLGQLIQELQQRERVGIATPDQRVLLSDLNDAKENGVAVTTIIPPANYGTILSQRVALRTGGPSL